MNRLKIIPYVGTTTNEPLDMFETTEDVIQLSS